MSSAAVEIKRMLSGLIAELTTRLKAESWRAES
jgi:hypothetical protein